MGGQFPAGQYGGCTVDALNERDGDSYPKVKELIATDTLSRPVSIYRADAAMAVPHLTRTSKYARVGMAVTITEYGRTIVKLLATVLHVWGIVIRMS